MEAYIQAQSTQNLDDFIYQRMLSAYGMLQIANRYCESWILSIKTHEDKDDRLKLFAKFLGLSGTVSDLPYLLFRHYLYMLKIIKVSITDLFNMEQKKKQMISYSKVQKAIKDQVSDQLDPFTRNSIYLRLMKVVKVDCKNSLVK